MLTLGGIKHLNSKEIPMLGNSQNGLLLGPERLEMYHESLRGSGFTQDGRQNFPNPSLGVRWHSMPHLGVTHRAAPATCLDGPAPSFILHLSLQLLGCYRVLFRLPRDAYVQTCTSPNTLLNQGKVPDHQVVNTVQLQVHLNNGTISLRSTWNSSNTIITRSWHRSTCLFSQTLSVASAFLVSSLHSSNISTLSE